MGRAREEANEIELTAIGVELNGPRRVPCTRSVVDALA